MNDVDQNKKALHIATGFCFSKLIPGQNVAPQTVQVDHVDESR